jgi:hypothetical protein
MSTIAGASNTIDWLTSAWADIQGQSSNATGIPILDAAAGADTGLDDGLSIADGDALASQLASIQDNLVQQQGVLAGQTALTRVQDAVKVKQDTAASISDTDTPALAQEDVLAQIDGLTEPGSIVDTTV